MSKSIAFLSGKGGSGKTTLALTIATMLSSCQIKVLLVDCDLVTNGATYFYEDLLDTYDPILSFYDILYNPNTGGVSRTPIEIVRDYYYFIPSLLKASDGKNLSSESFETAGLRFTSMYNAWDREYDVILFDCSAGYTDVLKFIVPNSNTNLVVLEADTVSMAAMRSLYLKIGSFLPGSKFYQIFNKIRPDIVREYTKRDGTFFTNIGAISFDWSICDAFSIASVPTIDSAGIEFGNQLNSICGILFQGAKFQNKLIRYGLILSLKKAQKEQDETQKSFIKYRTEYREENRDQWLFIIIAMTVGIGASVFSAINYTGEILPRFYTIMSLGIASVTLLSALFADLRLYKDIKARTLTIDVFKKRIEKFDDDIRMLEEQLNNPTSELTNHNNG